MCDISDALLRGQGDTQIFVLQGVRQPQAEATQDKLMQSPNRPDFTATLANFMAGGIDAALPDLAGPRPGSGQEPDEALLSPEPTARCRVSAAPPSVAGSVPGSSGANFNQYNIGRTPSGTKGFAWIVRDPFIFMSHYGHDSTAHPWSFLASYVLL